MASYLVDQAITFTNADLLLIRPFKAWEKIGQLIIPRKIQK